MSVSQFVCLCQFFTWTKLAITLPISKLGNQIWQGSKSGRRDKKDNDNDNKDNRDDKDNKGDKSISENWETDKLAAFTNI